MAAIRRTRPPGLCSVSKTAFLVLHQNQYDYPQRIFHTSCPTQIYLFFLNQSRTGSDGHSNLGDPGSSHSLQIAGTHLPLAHTLNDSESLPFSAGLSKMPRRTSRNQKIPNAMQDRVEKGIGTQSIAKANKVKAAVQKKPNYGDIKPLIDCLENQADYWKKKCVPVAEKQEEIEGLQDALEAEVAENEKLKDKVKTKEEEAKDLAKQLAKAKEEEAKDFAKQLAKTTKRLNKLVRKLKKFQPISSGNKPKHTEIGMEERELLDRLLDEYAERARRAGADPPLFAGIGGDRQSGAGRRRRAANGCRSQRVC